MHACSNLNSNQLTVLPTALFANNPSLFEVFACHDSDDTSMRGRLVENNMLTYIDPRMFQPITRV